MSLESFALIRSLLRRERGAASDWLDWVKALPARLLGTDGQMLAGGGSWQPPPSTLAGALQLQAVVLPAGSPLSRQRAGML